MSKVYEFHPLADAFPLMEGKEFDDLVQDIQDRGQRENIVLFEGKILDGRNRYRACVKLGIEPRLWKAPAFTYDEARAYVISANAHRRHLAPGEKYKIIEALLLADPSMSDRAIAEKATTNPMKVGRVRKRMAEAITSVTPDRRTGLDGKTYPTPAKKPAKKAPAEGALEWTASEPMHDGHMTYTAKVDGGCYTVSPCYFHPAMGNVVSADLIRPANNMKFKGYAVAHLPDGVGSGRRPLGKVSSVNKGKARAQAHYKPAYGPNPVAFPPEKPTTDQAAQSAEQSKREVVSVEMDDAMEWLEIVTEPPPLMDCTVETLAVEALSHNITPKSVRNIVELLGVVADCMVRISNTPKKPRPAQAAADRAEERAKNTAPASDGIDIPDELRRT